MPKSKKRKGHSNKVQSRKNEKLAKERAQKKRLQKMMLEFEKQQQMSAELQRETAKQVAKESQGQEIAMAANQTNSLTLPDLGIDAGGALLAATNSDLTTT